MNKYCLDTNVFIEPWNRYYSPKFTKGYWDILNKLSEKGVIFSPIEVKREIEKVNDELSQWIKNKAFFQEPNESIQECLKKIMMKYSRLVDNIKSRSIADPWVIAHAQSENATVVTAEQKAPRRIKIPDVCAKENIPCIDIHQFVKELKIEFTAKISRK